LRALLPVLRGKMSAGRKAQAAQRLAEIAKNNWTAKRERLAKDMLAVAGASPMDPRWLMMTIADTLPKDAVVVEEGLTSTFSLQSFLRFRDAQGFYGLASGGIGFAMAGAVGISVALPNRPVVAIVGDGSAMYSIQALWTAANLKRPITYVICNNRSYRILKERLVSMRGTEKFIGMDLRNPEIDFVTLSQSMGVPARRISDAQDVVPALRAAIASGVPNLLDISVADGFGA